MNNHVSAIYTDEIHMNLRPLFANWEPTTPIKLGDYGILQGSIFIRFGNIADIGFQFDERTDKRKDQKLFTTKVGTEVKFNAAGSAPAGGALTAKANLEINFSSDRAVFFNAADCEYSMVNNKVAMGDEVMDRFRKGKWERDWSIVTDIVTAGCTTLAVSGGSSSSIVFEATGNVPNVNLADATAGLAIKTARNVGYQVVAAQGLVPLMALCRIKPKFLWFKNDFRPLTMKMLNPFAVDALENAPQVETEGSAEELYFGQIEI